MREAAWEWCLLLVCGCGGEIAPRVATVPPAPSPIASSVPSPPPARAAYDGLYFGDPRSTDTCSLHGSWLCCLGPEAFMIAVSPTGRTLQPTPDGAPTFALEPGDGTWTLRTPSGTVLTQRTDPYLARIDQRLANRVFMRLDSGKYAAARASDVTVTSDAITMKDTMLATIELTERGATTCARGVLFADPTWNRSVPLGPAPPPPSPGTLGMRTYLLLKLEQPCTDPIDPHIKLRVHGAFGGARLFADADGQPLGMSLEGYMYGATFVTRGASPDVIDRVLAATAAAQQHQAE